MNFPNAKDTKMNTTDDLGDDLVITKIDGHRQMGGTWVHGSIAGHSFQVLVFEDHAENEEYELGSSRISKLWVRRQADRQVVANFDRGWDLQPTTDAAREIVDFLAAGIAENTFGK
jgi:hypothetical protein